MSSRKVFLLESSAPGSEAAQDKWLLLKKVKILETVLPQAAKLPGTNGFFKKKKQISGNSCAPGSEGAQDKWILQ